MARLGSSWRRTGFHSGMLLLLWLVVLGPLSPSEATDYAFTSIDVPYAQAQSTTVIGLNAQNVMVGGYLDAGGRDQGFLRVHGRFITLLNVTPQDINASGAIVGWFVGRSGTQGFVFRDGTFTPLTVPPTQPGDDPPTLLTEAIGMNDAGVVVGDYRDGRGMFHGFHYDSTTKQYSTIDWPGAKSTSLTGINNRGQMVGFFFDAQTRFHGFVVEGAQLTEVQAPGIAQPDLCGIADDGTMAGNTDEVGFVLKDGVVQVIEVPGATLTELFGIRNDGTIYGRYIAADGVQHGFVATPNGASLVHNLGHRPRGGSLMTVDCSMGSKRWSCRMR
jgi:hypothetical protein